ncbi:MICOS complex subunit MIC27-like [Patiria miniata]|uniref:MICOS complex subunit n=1 Tax=Patiria miniata TaxID=46514 RepID=A0A913ZL79_PATMI|nr:MICOS complex subunit MIC27-like [Patiria miniata]
MATQQMRRLLKLAALPAVAGSASLALGIPVLKAEALPIPGEPRRRRVLPKELPIYDEPSSEAEYRLEPIDTSGYVYQAVSVVRQNIWKFSESVEGAVEKTKQAYRFVEKTEQDIIAYIKTEEGFYPRVSAIALAGLTGVVLARKGGVFRKVLYSGVLMTATASVCYPYQVVKITKAEYQSLQSFWRDSIGSGVIDRVQGKMSQGSGKKKETESENPSLAQEDTPTSEDNASETAPSSDSTQPSADHGMANPEDKDMYSTRTS